MACERSGTTGAPVSGACAAGACGAGAGAGAGAGVGRLLTSRGERGGVSVSGAAAGTAVAGGAATWRGGAFLTGAVLGAAELDAEDTVFLAGAEVTAGAGAEAAAGAAEDDDEEEAGADDTALADFVALAAFFAGAGSSGWTGRRNPSASALRRTRSACASSIEDEWLLTPIPRERASSSPSLLVRPSSLASS